MKKLIVIAIVSMMASFQAFAAGEVDCLSGDARCAGYELDVNAEVLQSIDFTQQESLNLGQVTKGETVEVVAQWQDDQSRGKLAGLLIVKSSSSSEDVVVQCIADSSNVAFRETGDATTFDSCDIHAQGLVNQYDGQSVTIPSNNSADIAGPSGLYVYVGGVINVPSDATDGDRSGVMRVEVTYQ